MRIDVGIGEYAVVNTPDHSVKTYGLGSCIAVVFHSPGTGAAGMIHIALPDSRGHEDKVARLPGYFADTGLPLIWQELQKVGAVKGAVTAKLIGGATLMDDGGTFDIGRRNILAARKWLWTEGIGLVKEDTGGNIGRTVEIFQSGRVTIYSQGRMREF